MTQSECVAAPHHHDVSFYDHDGEVVGGIARYVIEGLADDERVVLVATEAHLAALDDILQLRGVDPSRARATGRYLTFDAAETLASFMVDGSPDREEFMTRIGGIVDAARRDGSAVRAFGEMVALLWEDGNVEAAIELEALWNELAQTREFHLLCAYPTRALDSAALDDVGRVCELHSDVLPPLSYRSLTAPSAPLDDARHSEVFVPVAEAVVAARNFVTGVLERWGEHQLFWDSAIITSELATNAVMAGRSPFRVVVDRGDGVIRISIEDVAPGWPQRRRATPEDAHGRGVAIVESLARRWGCDRLGEGKVVWAELRAALA